MNSKFLIFLYNSFCFCRRLSFQGYLVTSRISHLVKGGNNFQIMLSFILSLSKASSTLSLELVMKIRFKSAASLNLWTIHLRFRLLCFDQIKADTRALYERRKSENTLSLPWKMWYCLYQFKWMPGDCDKYS